MLPPISDVSHKEGRRGFGLNINWNPFSPLPPLGDGWLWIVLGDHRDSYASQSGLFFC